MYIYWKHKCNGPYHAVHLVQHGAVICLKYTTAAVQIKENICLSFNSVLCYFLAPFEL